MQLLCVQFYPEYTPPKHLSQITPLQENSIIGRAQGDYLSMEFSVSEHDCLNAHHQKWIEHAPEVSEGRAFVGLAQIPGNGLPQILPIL
jgi:hypothetical protein